MVSQLVECVPNISEGRDHEKIERIVDAVRNVPGCTILGCINLAAPVYFTRVSDPLSCIDERCRDFPVARQLSALSEVTLRWRLHRENDEGEGAWASAAVAFAAGRGEVLVPALS